MYLLTNVIVSLDKCNKCNFSQVNKKNVVAVIAVTVKTTVNLAAANLTGW